MRLYAADVDFHYLWMIYFTWRQLGSFDAFTSLLKCHISALNLIMIMMNTPYCLLDALLNDILSHLCDVFLYLVLHF